MYTVSYIQGNGHWCSCCRDATHEKRRFEDLESAVEFAARIKFLAANDPDLEELYENNVFVPEGFCEFDKDDDYELVQIYGSNRKHLLKDPEIQKRIEEWSEKIGQEIAESKRHLEDSRREKRRRQYEALKKEFEGNEEKS